jgi:O-glycosyl hydrolase
MMARRIRNDIVEKRAAAWIYWQFADNAGAWGFVNNRMDGRDPRYRLTRKFHVMAQFSRFIRPGCRILQGSDDDSLVAYDNGRRQLIIVTVNERSSSHRVTYKLQGVATTAGTVAVYRTSQQEDVASQPVLTLINDQFTATLPARSVTTFVIAGLGLHSE